MTFPLKIELPRYVEREPCAKCGSPIKRVKHIARIGEFAQDVFGINECLEVVCLGCGAVKQCKTLDAK